MPPTTGETIGERYRLDGTLGEGGMGIVYAATHIVTRKRFALKVLRGDYAADARTRQRFLREARAACAVRHPNVVQIHDVLELPGGVPAMVMELLEGETLANKLARDGRLDVAALARVMLPVLSAVGTAHELGIVHRDLKPENIFLAGARGGDVDVKVLDFGIAKLTATEGDAAQSGGLTGTGSMLGTPYYMSPEQSFGDKDVDHRADVWSLGVIFYECLCGERPTQAENIGQILKIVMTDRIRPLAERAPELPPAVTALVGRMLQQERTRRPHDLREVVEVLAPYADAPRGPSFGAPRSPRAITLTSEPPSGAPDAIEPLADLGVRGPAVTTGALSRPAMATALRRRPGYFAVAGAVVVAAGVGMWRLRAEGPPTPALVPSSGTSLLVTPAASTVDAPPSAAPSAVSMPSASASATPVPMPGARPTPRSTAIPPGAAAAVVPARRPTISTPGTSAAPAKAPADPGSYQ